MGFYQDQVVPRITDVALASGGCHLSRPIDRLVAQPGFSMTRMQNFYVTAAKPCGYTFEGVPAKA